MSVKSWLRQIWPATEAPRELEVAVMVNNRASQGCCVAVQTVQILLGNTGWLFVVVLYDCIYTSQKSLHVDMFTF